MNDRFNFKLQRVLDYREYVKDKCEELAKYREMLELEKIRCIGCRIRKRLLAKWMKNAAKV